MMISTNKLSINWVYIIYNMESFYSRTTNLLKNSLISEILIKIRYIPLVIKIGYTPFKKTTSYT